LKAIDIETISNIAMVDCLPEPEAPGNIKDPAKIAAAIEEKRRKQIDQMALSPLFGRICAYSTWGSLGGGYDVIDEVSDSAEIGLIERALEHLCITGDSMPEICTWNGFNFDIPFLFKRAMILKVALPSGCPGGKFFMKKYQTAPHCDVAQELCNWQTGAYMSLDVAASVILGEKKLDHDFTKFIELIESGKGEEIGIYCMKDSELTYRIYEEVAKYLF
jgi:DNA polymerase elongation subunit (family B)